MKFTFNDKDYEFEVVDEAYLDAFTEEPAEDIDCLHDIFCVKYKEKSTGLMYDAQIGIDVFPKDQDWEFNDKDLADDFDYDDYSPNFDDDDLEEDFECAFREAVCDDIEKHFQNRIENDEIPEFKERMSLAVKAQPEAKPEQPRSRTRNRI